MSETLTAVSKLRRFKRAYDHTKEALQYAARKPCIKRNCGTVCLCGPCHARRALELLEGEQQWQR